MFDIQTKIKRQIEILGVCASEENSFKIADLADFFGVEELTIKRDLQDLRTYGIDIHSTRNRGVCILSSINYEKIIETILHYSGLNYSTLSIDKPTSLLVEKFGVKALNHFVNLQLCVDRSVYALIDYNKTASKFESKKIKPLLIFQNEGTWRLLTQVDNGIKQFILEKILSVKMTEEKFEKISPIDVENLFRSSWKSWLGAEKYKIKLYISREWADRIKNRTLISGQKITELKDGSIMFEATVNALSELASWIVSRGEGVKVLAPPALRKQVIELANGVLKNY
jgi:predicted DNA-binding transcriptional regulator YafY